MYPASSVPIQKNEKLDLDSLIMLLESYSSEQIRQFRKLGELITTSIKSPQPFKVGAYSPNKINLINKPEFVTYIAQIRVLLIPLQVHIQKLEYRTYERIITRINQCAPDGALIEILNSDIESPQDVLKMKAGSKMDSRVWALEFFQKFAELHKPTYRDYGLDNIDNKKYLILAFHCDPIELGDTLIRLREKVKIQLLLDVSKRIIWKEPKDTNYYRARKQKALWVDLVNYLRRENRYTRGDKILLVVKYSCMDTLSDSVQDLNRHTKNNLRVHKNLIDHKHGKGYRIDPVYKVMLKDF